MRLNVVLIVLIPLMVAGCATTEQRIASPKDPFAMPIEEFMQEQATLRAGVAQGEPREFEAEELARFDEIGEQIEALVGDATELEQIPLYRRHRLYELRTEMVKLVVGDSDPQLICFKQHTTGTRLKDRTRCYTLQELETNRFEARRLMQEIQAHPQGKHPDS